MRIEEQIKKNSERMIAQLEKLNEGMELMQKQMQDMQLRMIEREEHIARNKPLDVE